MISKIEKARRYAQEPHRLRFEKFQVSFEGNHHNYTVTFDGGKWGCGCDFFQARGVCSHTMTLEKILDVMLPQSATEDGA
jgi:hypothetical protein